MSQSWRPGESQACSLRSARSAGSRQKVRAPAIGYGLQMRNEPQLAFCVREVEPPGVEVRVNFGVFAGRRATPAEIDDLAAALLPKVGEVSIVAEERHEIGEEAEASLNQVRIEVAPDHLPADE